MSDVEEVKSKVDLVELSKQYMTLRHAGRNFQALCPFHQEKTPSLMISPEKQIWQCFGCGEGGDIFTLVQKMEGVDFYESLKILAEKAGVELKKTPGFQKFKKETDKFYEINLLAAEFYHQAYKLSKSGELAREYVKGRGLSDEMVDKFKIGYAPDIWEALANFLTKRGYSKNEIVGAGLGVITRQGNLVDKFRQRLMFPIWDASGRVVGFTGRVLDEKDNPKYLNTSATKIFDKGKILYAMNLARDKMRSENRVLVCEGQMDVISCFQFGFDWSICSSGTAVTKQQLILLKRVTDNVFLAFDNDSAGQKAAYRLTQMALEIGLVVKVVNMGEYKDPDEMLRGDKDAWQDAVDNAESFVEYFLKVFDIDEKEVKDKSRLADQLMPLLYYVGDEVEKGHYLSKLADVLHVDEKFVLEKYNKYKPDQKAQSDEGETKKEIKMTISERLVGLMIVFFVYLKKSIKKLHKDDFSDKLKKIVEYLQTYEKDVVEMDDLYGVLDEEDKEWLRNLVMKIELDFAEIDKDLIISEFDQLNDRKLESARDTLKEDIEEKIIEAEKDGDREKTKEYIRSLQDLIIKGKK